MLRAEVAMLQLTVAEAIGLGPRGREYGLIRAAAASSDDEEGSGAAPRRRRSPCLEQLGCLFPARGVQWTRRDTKSQAPYLPSRLPWYTQPCGVVAARHA